MILFNFVCFAYTQKINYDAENTLYGCCFRLWLFSYAKRIAQTSDWSGHTQVFLCRLLRLL